MEPGDRQPAPGELAILQAFVNTSDLEDGAEQFSNPADLRDWLRERGLLEAGEAIDEAEWRRALAVREAFRALCAANNGESLDAGAVTTLNDATGRAGLLVRLGDDGGARLEPGGRGLDRALSRLLAIMYDAMGDGSWPRLKACQRDVCRWVFYDASKNRSGAWCTMAICGSREKARAYRRRRREA